MAKKLGVAERHPHCIIKLEVKFTIDICKLLCMEKKNLILNT